VTEIAAHSPSSYRKEFRMNFRKFSLKFVKPIVHMFVLVGIRTEQPASLPKAGEQSRYHWPEDYAAKTDNGCRRYCRTVQRPSRLRSQPGLLFM
jgi:hypothetical protein